MQEMSICKGLPIIQGLLLTLGYWNYGKSHLCFLLITGLANLSCNYRNFIHAMRLINNSLKKSIQSNCFYISFIIAAVK